MKEKCIKATQLIFAYGMSILLLICFICAVLYAAAITVGQPVSIVIHRIISEKILPPVYHTCIGLAFVGMLNLYLRGELLFRFDIQSKTNHKADDS